MLELHDDLVAPSEHMRFADGRMTALKSTQYKVAQELIEALVDLLHESISLVDDDQYHKEEADHLKEHLQHLEVEQVGTFPFPDVFLQVE